MIRLKGGRIIDPANGRDEIGDIFIEGGRIVAAPADPEAHETYDLSGRIVMAGGIDIHSHIAGGNVNMSRILLLEQHPGMDPHPGHAPYSTARWSTYETGRLYAEMGYTMVVEPALVAQGAMQAHLELADIPYIDRAGLAVLGNTDFLLQMLRDGNRGTDVLDDYVAWSVAATKCLGVKVINAGGGLAFKENVRTFGLDDVVPSYGVSSRAIMQALLTSVNRLGIPHPLHVHCNNLGVPGSSFVTAIETMEAAGGLPIHLAHIQFYGYGTEGKRSFSSAATMLAEALAFHKNVTVDIGQVMFGQTVTISGDVIRQYSGTGLAKPRKWILWDGDGTGGGIVPYKYSEKNFYNAMQWAIGLELFLLLDDPWRVFFTTDHPNGAPFTTYPQILHLLMDANERAEWIAEMPPRAREMMLLPQLRREYSLYEIAIMTRAAPARLLGLKDRGHLGVGAAADISVYTDRPDKTAMFSNADYVFKDGDLIVEDGEIKPYRFGRTHFIRPPQGSAQIDAWLKRYYDNYYGGLSHNVFAVPDAFSGGASHFEEQPCRT